VQRAREFAARSATREPGALHLLFALCQEKTTAAHRALEQCGADVGRIRTSAMQLAMGLAPPMRRPKSPLAPPPSMTSPQPSRPSSPPPAVPRPIPQAPPPKKKPKPVHVATTKPADASRFDLDPKRYPVLSQLGRNLTLAAALGEMDPVAAREDLVE